MSRYARLALLCLSALASAPLLQAAEPAGGGNLNVLLANSNNSSEFLPVEKAFDLTATADGPDRVRLDWVIAPGYYLYQSRLKFSSPSTEATLGAPELPAGDVKNDEFFGKQVVYHHALSVRLAVARAAGTALEFPLTVTYQGCAEAGLCYLPITKVLFPQGTAPGGAASESASMSASASMSVSAARSWEGFGILAGAAAFLLAGLTLRKGRKLELPAA